MTCREGTREIYALDDKGLKIKPSPCCIIDVAPLAPLAPLAPVVLGDNGVCE